MKQLLLKAAMLVVALAPNFYAQSTELPHFEHVAFAVGFDDAYVLCQSVTSDNGTIIASVSDPVSTFTRFGTTQIIKLDDIGLQEWNIEIPGTSTVGAFAQVGDAFFAIGQVGTDVEFGGVQLSAGHSFVAKVSQSGELVSVRPYADYGAEHARLHVTQTGKVLVVVSEKEEAFGNNVLAELGSNGEISELRVFERLLISDVETNDDGELFIAGMMLGRDTIDGIEITPPFGYINVLAKFSSDIEAEWVQLTEHITIDRDNRVELVGDRVVLLALEKADPPMLLKPTISVFDEQGEFVERVQLESRHTFKSAQIGAAGDYIIAAHDRHNSLGAGSKDTSDVWVFDRDLEVLAQHAVIGDITFHQSVLQSVHISNIDGGTRITWLCDSANAEIDGVEISMVENHDNGYLLSADFVVEGITAVEGHEFHTQPANKVVAVGSLLELETELLQATPVVFYDLQGRIRHTASTVSGSVYVPNLPEGHYTLVVGQQVVVNVVVER